MSSTASFIERGMSNLRTHQILALLKHLVIYKCTISGIWSTNRAGIEKQFRANVTWEQFKRLLIIDCAFACSRIKVQIESSIVISNKPVDDSGFRMNLT